MAFNIERVPNQAGQPAVLLRQAWREGSRILKKTIANLSMLPDHVIEGFRTVLKGSVAVGDVGDLMTVERSLAHGHVMAVLGTCRRLGFERLVHRHEGRQRQLALAAVVARVLPPDSRLATARRLSPETATSSPGPLLSLGPVTGNEMLAMLDWLLGRQRWIERVLARRHLEDATLILYDVSSSWLEGRKCPLAAFGHNRDGKKNRQQVVFGLLCSSQGCPIAVEVFAGNTADPATLASQVARIRRRFGMARVALVGDRGMITTARIRDDLEPAGLAWVSALKTADLRRLASGSKPALSPEALVADAVAGITSPDFSGERLRVCLNPRLREDRRRTREALLEATEEVPETIAASVCAGTLKGAARIGHRVGRDANRRKVEKHFDITITDTSFSWHRRRERIDREARFDGVHVVRTSLEDIAPDAAVEACKSLATVERAFRVARSDLRIRPVWVYTDDHVRGLVFLCMLAYYVEWNMRQRLAPLLFEDDDREAARRQRTTPVEKAQASPSARRKAQAKLTPDGLPVHSFRTLIDDLASVAVNVIRLPGAGRERTTIVTQRTRLQSRAFELLIEIDVEICMDESIAHPDDPLPRYLRQTLACGFADVCRRLTEDLDTLDQRKDQLAVLVEVAARSSPSE